MFGATLNTTGLLRVRATAVGADSALARISTLLEEAPGSQAPIQGLADRKAPAFAPLVFAVAPLPFSGWFFSLPGPSCALAVVYPATDLRPA